MILTFKQSISILYREFITSNGDEMKKSFLVCGLLFCSINIFPQYGQNFPVKQITSFSYDVKNPKFFENSFYSQNELLFESYIDSTINIGLLSYDSEKDTFSNPIKFTDNSGQNLNPLGIKFNGGKIVFYQTNIKGTWDIAYREFKDNQWGTPKILVDSTGDETNPSFIEEYYYYYPDSVKIFFEKDSSVFMLTKKDSLVRIDTIFARNDSVRYSQPTGFTQSVYDNKKWKEKISCISKQTNVQNKSRLVSSTFLDMQKISEKVLIDSGEVNNPKFRIVDNYTFTFENKLTGFSNIYFIDYRDPSDLSNSKIEQLIDDPTGDLSFLSSSNTPLIITKTSMNKSMNKGIFSPYTFKLRRNDSTFVRISNYKNYSFPADSMIYTKVINCKPLAGIAGILPGWQVFYYVWEDSIDGRINFVGKKELQPLGAVESETVIKNYNLYQNYPNPFNPITVIRYDIPSASFVTLKVYDILGREVAQLVNEEKLPGKYQVTFNASKFSSGIYFYRMKAGNFIKTNKLLLLK